MELEAQGTCKSKSRIGSGSLTESESEGSEEILFLPIPLPSLPSCRFTLDQNVLPIPTPLTTLLPLLVTSVNQPLIHYINSSYEITKVPSTNYQSKSPATFENPMFWLSMYSYPLQQSCILAQLGNVSAIIMSEHLISKNSICNLIKRLMFAFRSLTT